MPPPLCNKCRNTAAAEGDSWCLGCSCWESIGRELSASWDSPGARLLASDLVVNCARQVRALRSLSAGLARQESTRGSAGSAVPRPREGSRERADHRSSLPRRRSQEAVPPKEEEESGGEEEGSESEEEPERRRRRERSRTPLKKPHEGDRRPPEPDGPPPGLRSIGTTLSRADEGAPPAGRKRSHTRGRDSGQHRSGRRKNRGSTRRGGRKHQRLHRLALNPTKTVHRRLQGSVLELTSSQPGATDLGRLGR